MAEVRNIAETIGGEASPYPATPPECAKLKAQWAHGSNNGVAWYRVIDVTSAVIVFPDIARLYRGVELAICAFKGRVYDFHDRYLRPMTSGFREMLLVVEHSGHMCQVHLNTVAMLEAESSQGPRLEEVQQDIERAASEGNLAGCLSLLNWSKELGSAVGASSFLRALHPASQFGHAEIICALLRSRADANAKDSKGDTPLHLAAERGHDLAVWALLDQGAADCSLLNAVGESPLLLATRLVHQQPDNGPASNALRNLVRASGAEHVKQVALKLEAKRRSIAM